MKLLLLLRELFPTLLLFRDGQVAAQKIGALPKTQLYQWVESVLEEEAPRQALS